MRKGLFLLLLLVVAAVSAENRDVGEMTRDVDGQLNSVSLLFTGAAIILGIVLTGAGIIKIKSAQDPQQSGGATLKQALSLIIIGGLLTTIGSVVFIAKDSLFGTDSQAGEETDFTAQKRGHLGDFISSSSKSNEK